MNFNQSKIKNLKQLFERMLKSLTGDLETILGASYEPEVVKAFDKNFNQFQSDINFDERARVIAGAGDMGVFMKQLAHANHLARLGKRRIHEIDMHYASYFMPKIYDEEPPPNFYTDLLLTLVSGHLNGKQIDQGQILAVKTLSLHKAELKWGLPRETVNEPLQMWTVKFTPGYMNFAFEQGNGCKVDIGLAYFINEGTVLPKDLVHPGPTSYSVFSMLENSSFDAPGNFIPFQSLKDFIYYLTPRLTREATIAASSDQ